MDYGDLLKRGWNITWNHKYLWWLGFLAALGGSGGSGGGGGSNFNIPSGGGSGSGSSGSGDLPFSEAELERFFTDSSMWAGIGTAVFVLLACLILFFIVMWFIRLAAEAGLIHAAFEINAGNKMSFGEAFSHGRSHIGSFFVVNLILKSPPFLIGLAFACAIFLMIGGAAAAGDIEAIGAQMAAAAGTLIFLGLCAACLLIPYNFIVLLLYPIAQRGVVLGNLGAMDSIRHGWNMLKTYVGEMLLLGVIFWFMMLVVGIASLIVVLPILAATALPFAISMISNGTVSTPLAALAGLGVILMILASSFISSVVVVMRSSTFTLAYLEMLNRLKLGRTLAAE